MRKFIFEAVGFSLALFLAGCADHGTSNNIVPAEALSVTTAPNRPDLVSGGDARLIVSGGSSEGADSFQVTVNGVGQDVAFTLEGEQAQGVVSGLINGENIVRVTSSSGSAADLVITNHPKGGPLLSGPQLQPWVCATPEAREENGLEPATYASGLSNPPLDAQCNVVPEVRYYYRTTATDCEPRHGSENSCFQPYTPAAPRPADMSQTTTDQGKTLDYVVRVERGAINRGLYDIAVLHDPDASEGELGAWNRKLVWFFGGSTGYLRRQSQPVSTWALDHPLSKGFMVAVASLTDASQNANRVVAAETVLMLKEYVSDTYGLVRYTIGHGCSAGSTQQNITASMYPGALDGLVLACSFPDGDGHGQEIFDAFLLYRYFESPEFSQLNAGLTQDEVDRMRADIAGHKDTGSINGFGRYRFAYLPGVWGDAPMSNNCRLPNTMIYDTRTNPEGIRCAAADHSIAIWGTGPDDNFGRSVKDNEGVQYGLAALMDGKISPENFVQLNEAAGGIDHNGNFTSARSVADRTALKIAYETGLVSDSAAMASTPIIDLRGDDNSSVHYNWSSFALRDRLLAANGNLDNHVMWRVGLPGSGAPWTNPLWLDSGLPQMSLDVMDAWLAGIEADDGEGSDVQRTKRNRPDEAFDFCYLGTDYSRKVTDQATCDADPGLKIYSSIRQVAGGPRSSDILRCQLHPIDRSEYAGKLNDDQFARLEAVFPNGVCDWSIPGVGQVPSRGGWMDFSDQPGGSQLSELMRSH
nr:DUF6351 family protein [uncultured Hyphomonas sp.]